MEGRPAPAPPIWWEGHSAGAPRWEGRSAPRPSRRQLPVAPVCPRRTEGRAPPTKGSTWGPLKIRLFSCQRANRDRLAARRPRLSGWFQINEIVCAIDIRPHLAPTPLDCPRPQATGRGIPAGAALRAASPILGRVIQTEASILTYDHRHPMPRPYPLPAMLISARGWGVNLRRKIVLQKQYVHRETGHAWCGASPRNSAINGYAGTDPT